MSNRTKGSTQYLPKTSAEGCLTNINLNQSPRTVIAIDPSLNCTGWAIYRDGNLYRSGVIKTQGETPVEKLASLHTQLLKELYFPKEAITDAILEIPATFSYARSTGYSGKQLNQGCLQKLNWAIGVVMYTLKEYQEDMRIATVQAHIWKARRGKKLDQSIVLSLTGQKVGADEADAILLGLWHMKGQSTGNEKVHL